MTEVYMIYDSRFKKSFLDDLVANGLEPGTLFGTDKVAALDAYITALRMMDTPNVGDSTYYEGFSKLAMHLASVHNGFAELLMRRIALERQKDHPRRARLLLECLR